VGLAEVLFDYAENGDDSDAARAARELVVVRSGQRVFNDVVAAEYGVPRQDIEDAVRIATRIAA
jgi:hypothetical protein